MNESDLHIKTRDVEEHLRRTRVRGGPDIVIGRFFLTVEITAVLQDIYIPLTIASGKKPTGFVYQIEGTGPSTIVTANLSCRGVGITQVRLGTIVYAKIPKGVTAAFRIRVEVRGKVGKSYRVVIYQVNYKHSPTDARYQKYLQDMSTGMLKFS